MNNPDKVGGNLKIMILSSWKTGTTWLTDLLATIYNLPVRFSSDVFDPQNYADFPDNYIVKHHMRPGPDVIEWTVRNNVFVITTTRHPVDTFISLIHHWKNYPGDLKGAKFVSPEHVAAIMRSGLEPDKLENTADYARNYFYESLEITLEWLKTGMAYPVQYEDLLQNTPAVLTALTEKIRPVSRERIERAIEQNTLDMLREVYGRNKFFRQGEAGNWARDLPPDILEIFRTTEPYPHIFETLGYSLDPEKNRVIKAWELDKPANPFKGQTRPRFDNGIEISPVIQRLYLSLEPEITSRWDDPARTGPGSFYEWLNRPYSDPGETAAEDAPLLTNLAAYVARVNLDYRARFPDYPGKDRLYYLRDFLTNGWHQYKLSYVFWAPMRESIIDWYNRPSPQDLLAGRDDLPPITNLAAFVYHDHVGMEENYPDVYGKDRCDYLFWFLQLASAVYGLEPVYYANLTESFRYWANLPDKGDPALAERSGDSPPLISNLIRCFYNFRADCQVAFPDLYGQDRLRFLDWVAVHGQEDFNLSWDYMRELQNILPA